MFYHDDIGQMFITNVCGLGGKATNIMVIFG